MNKWEKEVQKSLLDSEEATLAELQKQYNRALRDIGQKVKAFQADIDMLDAALESDNLDDAARQRLLSQRRSKVYQKQYQEALQGQINGILDQMQGNNFTTIEAYLKQTYEDAYIGTMYDIHGQGIPIITPIDQAAAVKAVLTDSKISKGLYTALGMDIAGLKKSISAEITRGIASSLPYADIARNLNNVSKAGYKNAKRIVVTEGHRIQQTSANDARKAAIAKGANLVKQWNAALDGKTRPHHRQLDGQIREVDEPFEVDGMKAMFPGDFGDPAEDCNCRCTCLSRSRSAMDENELQTLKERAEFFGLDKTKDLEDFKNKYLKAAETIEKLGNSDILKMNLQLFAEKDIPKQESASLKKGIAKYKKRIAEHKQKLARPQDFVPNWDAKDEREQNGLKRHWQKEIKNFQQSIDDRTDELRKRGDL